MSSPDSPDAPAPEWFYIGHFGQLGPLTLGQLQDLAGDGVIGPETYVWRAGMPDWLRAGSVKDLEGALRASLASSAPTPPPSPGAALPPGIAPTRPAPPAIAYDTYDTGLATQPSDRSRYVAGALQVIPGVGRLYLGYMALGILQIVLTPFCGIGWIWSLIDGAVILGGGVKQDGYGRRLES
jgi:TM2 domain-containing membrane protein YozV